MNHDDIERCVTLWISYTDYFIHTKQNRKATLQELYRDRQWEEAFDLPETWWQFLKIASEKGFIFRNPEFDLDLTDAIFNPHLFQR